MFKILIILLIVAIPIAWIWLNPIFLKLKRNKIKNKSFSKQQLAILEKNLPIYQSLPLDIKKRLQGHIHVFLAEKQFIGCNGLQITDEVKLIVAAQACLLLLNEKGNYYSQLKSILIYPNAYITETTRSIEGYFIEKKQEVRIGESWSKDRVVLSWEHIKRDTKNWQDGHNVILHEFAHQLDAEDGSMNGVPLRDRKSDYITWALIFEKEYKKLLSNIEIGLKTVIDRYGATNPAEFFAVATETFFEKSKQLQQKHPELYEELKHYYQLNPVEWM